MYRQQSLSRISSRSLSKIKTKIDLAFARPSQQSKQSQLQPRQRPLRSNSTKSLSKYQIQMTQNKIPFALALKTGLLTAQKKASTYQTPAKKSKTQSRNHDAYHRKIGYGEEHKNRIVCSNQIKNESIKGYSWYHQKGKELVSVCKNNGGKLLRYFAVRQSKESKKTKRVLAALEDQHLFAGSKSYILVSSNHVGLIKPSEASQLAVAQSQFVLVLDQAVMSFCNVNRLVGDILGLLTDGLRDLDTIAKIIGKNLSLSKIQNSKKQEQEQAQVFVLLILIQEALIKYENASINLKERIASKLVHTMQKKRYERSQMVPNN